MNCDLRIEKHPILEFKRGKKITFQFEGKQVVAYENESIAAALFASGVKVLSRSKRFNNPIGWFCGIGKCCSCMMRVDGIPNVRTCVVPVREGMQVERQGQKAMLPSHFEIHVEREEMNIQVLIIGGGPAGCKGRSKIAAGGGLKSRHPRHTYTTTPTVSITFYSLFQYTNKLLFIRRQPLGHHVADLAA